MSVLKWIVAGFSALMLASTGVAETSLDAEEYVRVNANEVLESLTAPDVTAEDRRGQFQQYIDEFTRLDVIAKNTIGKRYASRFTDEEMEAYQTAFRNHALAEYEWLFNRYRGSEITVVKSIDRSPRDWIVFSEVAQANGEALDVRWHVLKHGGRYQVMDVAINIDGQIVWMAQFQKKQLLAVLDKENGSADAIIEILESKTQNRITQRIEESEQTTENEASDT